MADGGSVPSLKRLGELHGHDDRAWSVSWNPTHPILASCSADKNVRLWSFPNLKSSSFSSASAEDPTSSPTSPTISADAWTAKDLGKIETGHSKTVRSLSWSPFGTSLATASFDATIGVWEHPSLTPPDSEGHDTRSGLQELDAGKANGGWECASLLEGHENECKSVVYSASGTLLATCARDKTVWIWEVMPDGEFECAAVLMEHTQDVKAVAWHPHEDILASASYDDTIHIYTDDAGADDWSSVCTLKGHTSTVWAIAFSPNGEYLASTSDDLTVRIWKRGGKGQRDRWTQVLVLEGEHTRTIYSVSWAKGPGDQPETSLGLLATAGADGRINVWHISIWADDRLSLSTKLLARTEQAHGDHDVNCIAWCPYSGHEGQLATAGDDGYLRLWTIEL